jgi:hypothetical protein
MFHTVQVDSLAYFEGQKIGLDGGLNYSLYFAIVIILLQKNHFMGSKQQL